MQDIKVKKRDQSLEFYSYDKLLASITRSGVEIREAEELASEVDIWIKQEAKKGSVSSVAIRDKVIEVLSVNNPVEADEYQAFKKG